MGSSNAIATKAKAMFAKRLTLEDYQSLLKKQSVGEIAAYLKNETDYAMVLADVKENNIHRGELESLLSSDLYYKEVRLANYANSKNKEFYKSTLHRLEIEHILKRIKQVTSSLYRDLYADQKDIEYHEFCFSQAKLGQTESYDEILSVIKKTPYYELVKKYKPKGNENVDYVHLEKDLNHLYDDIMIANIEKYLHGKDKKDALMIYSTKIELQIISKIYRLKKYYHSDAASIRDHVDLTHTRMSTKLIDDLIHAPTAEDVLAIMEKSSFHFFMDDKEYIYIEYQAESIKYHLAKRYMRFSSSAPLVFMTYIILHQIEVMNLINIIEGVRYGMSEEQIQKTCIF